MAREGEQDAGRLGEEERVRLLVGQVAQLGHGRHRVAAERGPVVARLQQVRGRAQPTELATTGRNTNTVFNTEIGFGQYGVTVLDHAVHLRIGHERTDCALKPLPRRLSQPHNRRCQ